MTTGKDHLTQQIERMSQQAKAAAQILATISTANKNNALQNMANQLLDQKEEILAINQQEVIKAKGKQLKPALIDRMQLTEERFQAMVNGLTDIASLRDPVGNILKKWTVPSGLNISRVSVPLGVIGVIYESRPNVTADAAALCLKSGNSVILRGGSECAATNRAITNCLQTGLRASDLPEAAIQYVPQQSREAVSILLTMDKYIDVIVPRGGKSLIEHIRQYSRIPVFSHLDGVCHTYIHSNADRDMAVKIVVNAKMRRPGICGATETILIDEAITDSYLPEITNALITAGCNIRGDTRAQSIDARIVPATEQDWQTEYLEAIVSIRVVSGLSKAIDHINHYGSGHTDAIITNDQQAAQQFLNTVNSAIAMHNASTQFADGGEFGMGAEIGIATGKLHARGPVGLEQLTTFKYCVEGSGQVRGC